MMVICHVWALYTLCICVQNQGKPGHEIQRSTLELITSLVSLVHQQMMPDVAQKAMEVHRLPILIAFSHSALVGDNLPNVANFSRLLSIGSASLAGCVCVLVLFG